MLLALGLILIEFLLKNTLLRGFYNMYQLEEKLLVVVITTSFRNASGLLMDNDLEEKTKNKFASENLLKILSPEQSVFKSTLKHIGLSLAIASLIIALVNPKIGTKLETVKREGVDIVFAIDVSKSMLKLKISRQTDLKKQSSSHHKS